MCELSLSAKKCISLRFATLTLVQFFLLSAKQTFHQIDALKLNVAIPELVKLGDSFWLNCSSVRYTAETNKPNNFQDHHQLSDATTKVNNNNNEIYSIKWYKDEEEFYRFLPNAEPKVSIYETNGIQLDVSSIYTLTKIIIIIVIMIYCLVVVVLLETTILFVCEQKQKQKQMQVQVSLFVCFNSLNCSPISCIDLFPSQLLLLLLLDILLFKKIEPRKNFSRVASERNREKKNFNFFSLFFRSHKV